MLRQIVFVAMYKDLHFTLSVNRDKYTKRGQAQSGAQNSNHRTERKLSPPTIIMYRNETRKFSKMFSER